MPLAPPVLLTHRFFSVFALAEPVAHQCERLFNGLLRLLSDNGAGGAMVYLKQHTAPDEVRALPSSGSLLLVDLGKHVFDVLELLAGLLDCLQTRHGILSGVPDADECFVGF